ncbi:MAG: carbohydrate ABC transporter permease [Ruminococcaceae bacterium]|nr:carbohydrate ABC transporter permease [Oscillospiraceae bacterium]
MKRTSRIRFFRTLRLTLFFVWALCFAVVFVTPTLLTFTNSFMSETELTSSYGAVLGNVAGGSSYMSQDVSLKLIPDMVSFKQYFTFLLQSPDYLLKFWNSVILTLPIVLGQMILASLASYGFYKCRGKVKNVVFFSYIILMLMPYQVTLVPNFIVSEMLGIINTRWAIILPGLFTPLSVFILTKSMRRIPQAAIDAAKLDGAGDFKIFSKICLPMCKNALYSVAILTFIDNWNMVEQVLVLMDNTETQPLSVFLSQINTGEVGVAFAVATVYMIPPILLFLHGEESLVEGITYQGSVKG